VRFKFKLSYFYSLTVVVWVLLLYPTLTSWQESVRYLVFLSWWSNFSTDINNWMTAHAKERGERDAKAVKKEAVTQIVEEAGKQSGQDR